MSRVQLIDTSMWIPALKRQGDKALRKTVTDLMNDGFARWCEPIRLELYRGVNSDYDRHILSQLDRQIPRLEIALQTWQLACSLAERGRSMGLRFPSADLLIFACAKLHDVPILSCDTHFQAIKNVWSFSGSI